ncbi:MAG: glycosyltransferase family 2 protein [Butyrivibrio sp.]|nr:glycosyltransferase family 2 protein [Butyrivibrio sp.]
MVATGSDIKFSVITPAYNVENYIQRCVESVNKQKYKRFEHIVVDDGSLDDTYKICERLASENENLKILQQNNSGAGAARNKAIMSAKGEWLVFLDADDILDEMALQELDYLTDISNDIDVVLFRFDIFNERTIRKMVSHRDMQREMYPQIFSGEKLWNLFFTDNRVGGAVCNKTVRREYIIANNLFFPEYRAREDAFWFRKMMMHGAKCLYSKNVLYHQCMRYGSVEQSKYNQSFVEYMHIHSETYDYIKKTYPQLVGAALEVCIKSKIKSLELIRADGLHRKYASDYLNIKNELGKDIKMTAVKNVDCRLTKLARMAIDDDVGWKIKCINLGLKRRGTRLKRFLYAELFKEKRKL